MGKLIFLFTIVVAIFFQKIHGQNYEVSYSIIYKPHISDTLKIKENYILKFDVNKSESLFISSISDDSFNATIYKNFSKMNSLNMKKLLMDTIELPISSIIKIGNYYRTKKNFWDLLVKKHI